MLGGSEHLQRGSSWRTADGAGARLVGAAVAPIRRASTAGTLATRMLVAGVLLVVGLPALTLLLHFSSLPGPARLPFAVLVDGVQVLIVAYGAVIAAQLLRHAGSAAARVVRGMSGAAAGRALPPADGPSPVEPALPAPALTYAGLIELRQWSMRLADQIWTEERRGRAEFAAAVLACLRDGVAVELEHRRRAADLDRRAAELEAWTLQDSVVASERM